MRIRLKEKRAETEDVMSFIFDLRGQSLDYRPGQFIYYQLDTLALPDERGNRRHFTISSSPTDKGIVMFTTRMRGSGFKETLRRASPGYELTCDKPLGGFVVQEKDRDKHHVFIAGGIGITPYRSILRYALHTNERLNVVMLYFNRASGGIVFRSELEDMARQMPAFSLVNVLSEPDADWKGERGTLDQALLERRVPSWKDAIFWISGPPPMVFAFSDTLTKAGIKEQMIRADRFLGY